MKARTIWETPKESINGASRMSFNYSEGVLKLKLKYSKNNVETFSELTFEGVICFRHIGGYFAN